MRSTRAAQRLAGGNRAGNANRWQLICRLARAQMRLSRSVFLRWIVPLLCVLAAMLPTTRPALAQEPAAKRPRIGVVLSGGGARGAAHVGVLKVLEELRIPVDLLAGNSMGALVGGIYSYGY